MPELPAKKKLSYIPGLDGLRGFFCLMVVIHHWQMVLPISPVGWEGLQTFFLMSGFLISRILINERNQHATFKSYIKSFYLKRSLRIFPLYFIYIIFWGLMRLVFQQSDFIQSSTQELADHWPMYMTYTSNLKSLVNVNAQDTPFFAHLWSLGMEEQFYLVMPFIIFFFKGKWLKAALIAMILIPFATRIMGMQFLTQYNDSEIWAGILIYRNLIFQMDSFALGAALAVFNLDFIKHPKRWLFFFFSVFVGLTVYHYGLVADYVPVLMKYYKAVYNADFGAVQINVFRYIKVLGMPEMLAMGQQYIYMMPLVNIITFLLVLSCIRGKTAVKWIFENKYIIKIGKVSYGMYVLHYCLIVIFLLLLSLLLGKPVVKLNVLLHIPIFIVYLYLLYMLSKLSYRYIETPFLKIKNKVR